MPKTRKQVFYVYRMRHEPSGRTYIGKRACPLNFTPKTDPYFGSGVKWKEIYKAFPTECTKEILTKCHSQQQVNRLEMVWIALEKESNPVGCVNISMGSGGAQHDSESRRKISEGFRNVLLQVSMFLCMGIIRSRIKR